MILLMNHINSTRRRSLGGKAPYELVDEHDEDMQALFSLLKMDLIPPDEVHLNLGEALVYAFATSLGYGLAMVIFAGRRFPVLSDRHRKFRDRLRIR